MRRRPSLASARLAATLPLALVAAACARPASTTPATPAPAPAAADAAGRPAGPGSSIAARTSGLQRQDGLLALYVDERQGKLLIEIPRDSMRVIFAVTGPTGLGSNPVGIDRGADGDSWVARFDRSGERVLVVLENWSYRSSAADNAAHVRSVQESFPPSTVAALPILAQEAGRILVDATDFALRDWRGVAGTLQRGNQGGYAVAKDRSGIYKPYTKSFPRNTEVDVQLTFAAQGNPGRIVNMITPDGQAFTLRQHLSFIALPDDEYRPRANDPRVGYFGITFRDYAQPIQGSLEQRWIARHRLERVNPADPNSAFRNPLVYYVDRGMPEPIRSATLEGVRWWSDAFDRAGLQGAFRVELLPEGVDPMDARYNVVQWVNRHERGWSIGGSLGDPRTGEILKAMARLDSHRARTDYNLYAGLLGADAAAADTAFVLARVRQVSAHEVGHTLGLAHNYIASTYERGSLMDYPPPRVRLRADGEIDIAEAYDVGPGEYDVWAVRWGYGIFPPASEADSLRAIVRDGLRQGFLFLADADARPASASDPRTNLWDDAATAEEFLRHQMDVRRVATRRFGERNIRPGEPVALLQERFAPVYFMHRFALNGLAKTVGGMEYSFATRGDGLQATRPIAAGRQRAALDQLLAALAPGELVIPDTLLTLLAPRPYGYPGSVELFGTRTAPAFDELGAARTLAQMVVDLVLQPERAARLVQFAARSPDALTLAQTIDRLTAATWDAAAPAAPKLAAVQRVTQRAVADRLITLAADSGAAPEVRAMAHFKLTELRPTAQRRSRTGDDAARAHWLAIHDDMGRWLERGEQPAVSPALVAPPGDPFGEEP